MRNLIKVALFILIIVLVNLYAMPEDGIKIVLNFEIIPEALYQPTVDLVGNIKWTHK